MPVERSAGIILFNLTPQGRKYLLLHATQKRIGGKDFWDFPKGILDKGESGIDAAVRETKEETGITEFKVIQDFKETVSYFTWREDRAVPKYVALFLAETKNIEVRLSWEHDEYAWLSYSDASQRISLPPMKEALKKAEKFLEINLK